MHMPPAMNQAGYSDIPSPSPVTSKNIMNRAASLILVSALSVATTLLVLNVTNHQSNLYPPIRSSAPPLNAPRIFNEPTYVRYEQPAPAHYAWYGPRRALNAQKYEGRVRPSSMKVQQAFGRRMDYPRTAAQVMRQEGSDCSSDPLSCGTGFYCCNNVCIKAVKAQVLYAADDSGELWICQQSGYNMVSSSSAQTPLGSYSDWLPCTDTYLKATNTELEGGGSIAVLVDNVPYGSGNNLPVTSQTDFSGPFEPVVPFPALNTTWPYSYLISAYSAYPVKDAKNPYAGTTNLKFTPPTC